MRLVATVLGLLLASGTHAQTVTHMAAGEVHSIFTKSDGSLWGMGCNGDGQLGLGPLLTLTNIPQLIVSNGVGQIVAGGFHSLFQSGHSLWAMGYNEYGELGDGSTNVYQFVPEQVVTVSSQVGVGPIAAGTFHSLFGTHYTILAAPGDLWAMGENQLGQLGDGSVNSTNKPEVIVAVPVGTALTAAAGGYDHSLFIRPGGVLWATGDNAYGQLGDLATIGWYTTIPKMIVSSNVTAVAAGWWYSLFAKSDDSLWAMGWNLYGQLGDGTTNSSAVPKLILASNVVAVAAGDFHSLFVKSDGSLWGMGYNGRGQLGDGTTNESHIPKLIVSSGVVAVSAGRGHSLFLKSDGSLWGIGENDSGQLGLGDFTDRHVPTLIYPRPPTITSISVSGTNVVVSWPANNFPFYLQSATNLVPPVAWTIVLSPTNIIGDQVFVTNPIAGPQQFYRLSD